MNINNFMTVQEACHRWNIAEVRLQEKLKPSRRNDGKIEQFIAKGWIKYFAKEGKRGSWIISTMLMEEWYGVEPSNYFLDIEQQSQAQDKHTENYFNKLLSAKEK